MFRIKRFSYLRHTSIGALGGGITGAAVGYKTSNKGKKKSGAIKGAILGSTAGAALGAGAKYGKVRYKKYIGTPQKADLTHIRKGGQAGDIVIADRGSYQHYGILDKNGNVIEYGSHKFDPRTARVGRVSLDEFSNGSAVKLETPKGPYSRDEIVGRAESWIGKDRGQYNLRQNNCEHFAREMTTGKKVSSQADRFNEKIKENVDSKINRLADIFTQRKFSFVRTPGDRILAQQFRHFVGNDLYGVRSKLTRELGGLSHFNKHQSHYLSGAGSVVGGVIGRKTEERKAKKDAVNKYGLKKGTLEYDNYVNSRKNKGTLIGAGIGAGAGFAASKGTDWVRGKVISDKARVKYGDKLDLGKNYMATGKALRGITSEKDIENISGNIGETADYLKGLSKMI
jgi:hypothetical protein